MALTIFAEHNVSMELLGFRLTPQWLDNINVVIITLGGFLLPPVFAKIRQKTPLTVPMQFGIGLYYDPLTTITGSIYSNYGYM